MPASSERRHMLLLWIVTRMDHPFVLCALGSGISSISLSNKNIFIEHNEVHRL